MVLHLLRCRFSFVKFLNIVKMAYRINGFEQIKGFYSWVFNNPDKVRPTHISLYLFLLNQNNRSNWVEWFKCPYDLAMQGACIGNKGTYYKCLDDLKGWKIIDYKKGINNYKAPIVKLFQLYDNEQLTEQVTVPLSEPQTVPLTVPIYKLITDNEKLLTENIESVKVFILELKKKNTGKDNIIDIDKIYNLYPAKCPFRNVSTGKTKKNKDKIKSLLNDYTVEELETTIKTYVSECVQSKTYFKNFTTLLNNLPDYSQSEQEIKTTPDIPNTMNLDWRYNNIIDKKS